MKPFLLSLLLALPALAQTANRTVMTDRNTVLTGQFTGLFAANSNRLHAVIGVTNVPAYVDARVQKVVVTNVAALLATTTIPGLYREAFVQFDTGYDGAQGDWFFDPSAVASTNSICRKPNDTSTGRWIKKQ